MNTRIEEILDRATLDEQISLLAGANFWETVAIERLNVPVMRVTDGPVGARGTRFDGEASVCVPCGTLLGATWDRALMAEVGELLGNETLAKGATALLAPTVNLHRTPVGGRNFECISEDPYLTAQIAVGYINGLQAQGVASCIKHFVGNDTEFERMTIDSQIDERTLRELYLVPFEAAVAEAGVLAVMTGYNRINGPFCADSALVTDVLRGEWGFDGLVMSDWFGMHSTVASANAGVDLEMPGPTRYRGQMLTDAVQQGQVSEAQIRSLARSVLTLMQRTGALDAAGPGAETTRDNVADRLLVRRAGSAGMVLLRNQPSPAGQPTLPIATDRLRTVAIVGPNATIGQIMGGGSAHVTPTHTVHPLEALRARFVAAGVQVVHSAGCAIHRRTPEINLQLCDEMRVDFFVDPDDLDRADATPVSSGVTGTTRVIWATDPVGLNNGDPTFGVRFSTNFTADASGLWTFGIESIGPAQLSIDGQMLIDNAAVTAGGSFFGMGRGEALGTLDLERGRTYSFVTEMRHRPIGTGLSGINIGAVAPVIGDPFADAVDMAATADLTIVVVGTNDDWESEGWDRADLDLPGAQDKLVAAVAQVCPSTVVVVNAGSPVAMPWVDQVDAVLMAWFPGQEFGDSLADVLFGDVQPQGRLPVTMPRQLQDTPAFEHTPGRNGVARYLEGRLMGYRWYDTTGRQPLFPFGFGLGYAAATVTAATVTDPWTIQVDVSNDDQRDAIEVVQVYAHQVDRTGLDADEPDQRLVGFAKVNVAVGTTSAVEIRLDPHAYRAWDTTNRCWRQATGAFELRVGRSSRDIDIRVTVVLAAAGNDIAQPSGEVLP